MLVPLREAAGPACGGKAGALGALLRAGMPVPDGFVVPVAVYRSVVRGLPGAEGGAIQEAVRTGALPAGLRGALSDGLAALGDPPVAVRSSATNEDSAQASAAGQYESVLAARGLEGVAEAVRTCWASLHDARATEYARHQDGDQAPDEQGMAVLIQRHVDAEISGVMFTPDDSGGATEIEASWGLGPTVAGGTVTPDAYRVTEHGAITRTIADKRIRLDRRGPHLRTREVPAGSRKRAALQDGEVMRLARLGRQIAETLGGAQDVEWSIAGGRLWILQARPITATLPTPPASSSAAGTGAAALTGTPGSPGRSTGTARIVRGPADFNRVGPGDILVCHYTDPAWTPLLRIATGVVTETGGVLSHAAIVARELHIPAVLGIPEVTNSLQEGTTVTIDGTAGTVTTPAT